MHGQLLVHTWKKSLLNELRIRLSLLCSFHDDLMKDHKIAATVQLKNVHSINCQMILYDYINIRHLIIVRADIILTCRRYQDYN